MFYHQSILNRRGGVFGTVCDDILDYIMVRKQPSVPGRSRPRFSLYLSAKLMYGCVKLYRKQTQYLLEDISSFLVKVRLAVHIGENIDLNVACRPELVTMPDFLSMSLEKQPFYDPYFGRIDYREIVEQTELPALDEHNMQALLDDSVKLPVDAVPPTDSTLFQPDVSVPIIGEYPVKGSEAFINLSSPSKTLDGGKELEKEMLSPKEKTPRCQLEDVLPDAPPAPRDHRPRSPEVTMLPPTEEEPRRSSRKRVPIIKKSDCTTLFNQPGSRGLRCGPLLTMWQQNLNLGLWETQSDVETPFWTVPTISTVRLNPINTMASRYITWTVPQLKKELIQRDASTHGRKTDLIERLESYDRNKNFLPPPVLLPEPLDVNWPSTGFQQLKPDHQGLLPVVTRDQTEAYFLHRLAVSCLYEGVRLQLLVMCYIPQFYYHGINYEETETHFL
uniref:SAP domain-containing protein n=1 Tax=Magallana gigas TaxID=29159 RepID=A0A8W8IXM2_MAGGI